MRDYNRDQLEALLMVQHYLEGLPEFEIERLHASVAPYLQLKQFTWPDKPLLPEELEELFLQAGLQNPLMYCHPSPGLRRVKAQREHIPSKSTGPGCGNNPPHGRSPTPLP